MTNESKKRLEKLLKYEVFSIDIAEAINELIETVEIQRKQLVQPSPFQRPKSFKRWTAVEESKLVASFLDGMTLDKIAEEHERSCNAIFHRLLLTGIVSLSESIDFFDKSTKPKKESATDALVAGKEILPGRICTTCGERIDPLRLSAEPNTYRCVPCQKDFEKRTGLSMNKNFT
jgi:hypothetical protein